MAPQTSFRPVVIAFPMMGSSGSNKCGPRIAARHSNVLARRTAKKCRFGWVAEVEAAEGFD